MKKIVIYETESFKVGTRPHMFDWEVGDEIITNGENSEIINIVDETKFHDVKRIVNNYKSLKTKISNALSRAREINFLNELNEESRNFLKVLGININVNHVEIPSKEVIQKELNIQYEKTIEMLMSI